MYLVRAGPILRKEVFKFKFVSDDQDNVIDDIRWAKETWKTIKNKKNICNKYLSA